MNKNKLPVVDLNKQTVSGELSIQDKRLKLGEAKIKVLKTLKKVEIDENGYVKKEIKVDTKGWEIIEINGEKQETDYVVNLEQERIIKMRFLRTPDEVQNGIDAVLKILSVFQAYDEAKNVLEDGIVGTSKAIEIATVMSEEFSNWIKYTSNLELKEFEEIDLESMLAYFNFYNKNNPQLIKQALIFLARNPNQMKV